MFAWWWRRASALGKRAVMTVSRSQDGRRPRCLTFVTAATATNFMATSSLPLCYSSSTDLLAHLDGEWLPRSTAPRQPYLLPIGHQLEIQWSQACWNTSYIMDSKRKVASSKPTDFHLNVTPPLDVVCSVVSRDVLSPPPLLLLLLPGPSPSPSPWP